MKANSSNGTALVQEAANAEQEPPPPKKTLAAKVLFIPYAVVFLSILCFFDIAQKIALLFSSRAQEKAASGLNRSVLESLKLLGTKVIIQGTPEASLEHPCIVISNHQSMFDLPVLYTIFNKHRPRYVSKLELSHGVPGISVCLRNDGSALIDRKNPKQAIPAIRALGEKMNEHRFATILFPEGTRARRGLLKPFHRAGFSVLMDTVTNPTIIPVAIDGTWKLTAFKRGPVPTGVIVKVKIAPPLKQGNKSSSELLNEAHEIIKKMLSELRA